MKNQYFHWERLLGWDPVFRHDDEFSEELGSLLAGRDFAPGTPLVIECYHISAFDRKADRYVGGPATQEIFNVPRLGRKGRIISTARWPFRSSCAFLRYIRTTSYYKHVIEHWNRSDFDTPPPPSGDIQLALRVLFVGSVRPVSSSNGTPVTVRSPRFHAPLRR